MTILEIIHCLAFYLKHDVSESGFCLRLHVEPTQMGPADRANLCLWTTDNTSSVYKASTTQTTLNVVGGCVVLSLLYKPYWCCGWCPGTETSSIYWAQLRRLHLEKELSLQNVRVRVTLRLTVSQYVLVSNQLCGRLTRYCFLFKSLGLGFVVLSLWGALSDERPGLSFVSHSQVIFLCVPLLFTFLSFTPLPHTYIYIYIQYTIHIIHSRPLSVPVRYSRLCPTTR
jgi:hypothetical protein